MTITVVVTLGHIVAAVIMAHIVVTAYHAYSVGRALDAIVSELAELEQDVYTHIYEHKESES